MLTYQSAGCGHPQRSWNGEEEPTAHAKRKLPREQLRALGPRATRQNWKMRAERISPTQKAIVLAFARRKCPSTHAALPEEEFEERCSETGQENKGKVPTCACFRRRMQLKQKERRTGAWPPAWGKKLPRRSLRRGVAQYLQPRLYGATSSSCCWRLRACCRYLCGVRVCCVSGAKAVTEIERQREREDGPTCAAVASSLCTTRVFTFFSAAPAAQRDAAAAY